MSAKVKKPRSPSTPDPEKSNGKKPGKRGEGGPKIDTYHTTIDASVDELLQLYARIDKAAQSLPTVSAMPFVQLFWNSIKFCFALVGDILLIIPNIVVFIRNLFPGRWSYKCFSWKFLKAAASWVWTGEVWIPSISFRPLSIGLLHWHFRNRLAALRRHIVLDSGFAGDMSKAPLAKIDRAIELWQPHATLKSILFVWILPLVGPVTSLWNWFFPENFSLPPLWIRFAVFISLSYALSILATSVIVKRGLMLGATGQAAHYPGFLPGPGAYAQEKKTLTALGLTASEFPLDAVVLFGSLILGMLTVSTQLEVIHELYESFNLAPQEALEAQKNLQMKTNIMVFAFWIVVGVVGLIRRRKLGRA